MADIMWPKCAKLLVISIGLMIFEAGFFVAFLSLSVGFQVAISAILKLGFDYDFKEAWQAFISWYFLALLTHINLRVYRKSVYPKIRNLIRSHKISLLWLPRLLYFVLYCFCIFGVFREYEATHGYPPVRRLSADVSSVSTVNGSLVKTFNYKWVPIQDAQSPDHKLRTFFFLAEMSYIVYVTSQVLGIYMARLSKGMPESPILPQFVGLLSMTIVQLVLTCLYSLPIALCLIGCQTFAVDGVSTFLLALCLALSVALAASQLESTSPFPTTSKIGPYYFFEACHQAKMNLSVSFLPGIALYYYSSTRSYPLNALNREFVTYVYWTNTALLHTVKSMYMTTWNPPVAPRAPAPAGGGANVQGRLQRQHQQAELLRGGAVGVVVEDVEMGRIGGVARPLEVQHPLARITQVTSEDSGEVLEGAECGNSIDSGAKEGPSSSMQAKNEDQKAGGSLGYKVIEEPGTNFQEKIVLGDETAESDTKPPLNGVVDCNENQVEVTS